MIRQLSEWSGLLNVRNPNRLTVRLWPVREIPTFKLLAENRPFGSARRDQFKRNRQRQVVAGSSRTNTMPESCC